jgi:hypothetical protein
MMDNGYFIGDFDWRKEAGNERVLLSCGLVCLEREVYLAVEKLSPFLQEQEERYPNEEDITTFILILRGP